MKNGDTTLLQRVENLEQTVRDNVNVISAKDVVIDEQNQVLTKTQERLSNSKIRIRQLEEYLRLMRANQFAAHSEKSRYLNVNQQELQFDEIETLSETEVPEEESTLVQEHSRKKKGGGRKPLPDDLPREHVMLDIDESEKTCGCGHKLTQIGEEISEQLEVIPTQMRVICTHRLKYACKHCEGTESQSGAVQIAKQSVQLLPKSIATPSLIAHIITQKFVDGLPLYRQSKIYARLKVDLPDKKMSRWLLQVAKQCEPLKSLFYQRIVDDDIVGVDETPLQVLKEPGRKNQKKSYMWVFRFGTREKPMILYHYTTHRSGSVPSNILADYRGYLQTDGYPGYNALGKRDGIIHVGCWAHARRKFVDVTKSLSPKKRKKGAIADQAIDYIKDLYEIERKGRALSLDELHALRQKKTVPLLVEFKEWLDEKEVVVPDKSILGKALGYTLGQWEKLSRFTLDPRITPDNNLTENAIRPFVIGRKNWLFSGSPKGADASAFYYSLVETAKACGLNPYAYLRFVFENLPHAKTNDDYNALLPMNINLEQLAIS